METNSLAHHGIKGQRWGVRRFQTKDGDLTPAGKKRYITVREAAKNATQARKEAVRSLNESSKKHTLAQYNAAAKQAHKKSITNDKAHNKQLRKEKIANVMLKIASKKIEDLNTERETKRRQELEDMLFPYKKEQRKWNERDRVKSPKERLEEWDKRNRVKSPKERLEEWDKRNTI